MNTDLLHFFRIILGTEDLEVYFHDLTSKDNLPNFEKLLLLAQTLVQQYVSTGAYEQVLSKTVQDNVVNPKLKVKQGTTWLAPSCAPSLEQTKQFELETASRDPEDFDGDCSLANLIAFKIQFGSWLLLDYAIKGGDVGRVMQLLDMRICIAFHLDMFYLVFL